MKLQSKTKQDLKNLKLNLFLVFFFLTQTWMSRKSLLVIGAISAVEMIATGARGSLFLDIQATIECGFSLKCIRDMILTYSQMHRTDKYSRHSPIIWPIWLNGWVFVYKLSGSEFEWRCNHLNFRYPVCFEQGVPWRSGN